MFNKTVFSITVTVVGTYGVYLYVYIYTHVHVIYKVCVYMCIYIYIYTHTYIYIYIVLKCFQTLIHISSTMFRSKRAQVPLGHNVHSSVKALFPAETN